jgi:hypothetical protein
MLTFYSDYLDKCKTEVVLLKQMVAQIKITTALLMQKINVLQYLVSSFQGCPDSDGDGIDDANDKCPNIKGLDIFKGCPV